MHARCFSFSQGPHFAHDILSSRNPLGPLSAQNDSYLMSPPPEHSINLPKVDFPSGTKRRSGSNEGENARDKKRSRSRSPREHNPYPSPPSSGDPLPHIPLPLPNIPALPAELLDAPYLNRLPSQRAIRFYQIIEGQSNSSENVRVPVHLFCSLEEERTAATLLQLKGTSYQGSDFFASRPLKGNKGWQDPKSNLVFAFCIANIPPCGKAVIRFAGQWMGRDELIAKIIELALGDEYYTRKIISSHTQVLGNKLRHTEVHSQLKTPAEEMARYDGQKIRLSFNDDLRVFLGIDSNFRLDEVPVPRLARVSRSMGVWRAAASNPHRRATTT